MQAEERGEKVTRGRRKRKAVDGAAPEQTMATDARAEIEAISDTALVLHLPGGAYITGVTMAQLRELMTAP